MSDNATLFSKLRNAPATVFENITPQTDETPANQAKTGNGATVDPSPGHVSEAEAMAGVSGAEYSDLQPNTGATAQLGSATPTDDTKGKLGHLLNAKTAIGIVDAILPAIAVIAMQYFMGIKMNKRELQLNEGERAIIQLPLQNWLNSVVVNFDSPLNALLITVGAVYGSKFAEKGFAAYFDKRDAENANAERTAQIKKELTPVVTPAPVITLQNQNGQRTAATTDETNEYGFTKDEMRDERAIMVKAGKRPNNRDVAASIRRKQLSKK